jgi:hypothetical protein
MIYSFTKKASRGFTEPGLCGAAPWQDVQETAEDEEGHLARLEELYEKVFPEM